MPTPNQRLAQPGDIFILLVPVAQEYHSLLLIINSFFTLGVGFRLERAAQQWVAADVAPLRSTTRLNPTVVWLFQQR